MYPSVPVFDLACTFYGSPRDAGPAQGKLNPPGTAPNLKYDFGSPWGVKMKSQNSTKSTIDGVISGVQNTCYSGRCLVLPETFFQFTTARTGSRYADTNQ